MCRENQLRPAWNNFSISDFSTWTLPQPKSVNEESEQKVQLFEKKEVTEEGPNNEKQVTGEFKM